MRTAIVFVSTAFVLLLLADHATAHHAFSAEFDAAKPVLLKGKVTKMMWTNPHSWLYIDVTEPDGTVVNWAIECGAPNSMLRRGWNKVSLPLGMDIVVKGYRAKNGSNSANGANVTLPDGKRLFVGSSGTGAPEDPDQQK